MGEGSGIVLAVENENAAKWTKSAARLCACQLKTLDRHSFRAVSAASCPEKTSDQFLRPPA